MTCCNHLASSIDKLPPLRRPAPDKIFDNHWLKLERGLIRYIEVGNPQALDTIIMMPDPPNTIEHMEELIRLLEKDFKVIVFEGLGFGYSKPFLSYDFSLRHNADVIIELLEQLEIKRAILALTCIGALPGLLAAKEKPKLITGLVLGQTPSLDEAKKWATRVDFKGTLGRPFIGQIVLRALRNKVSDLWYKNALPRSANRSPILNKTLKSFKKGAQFALASALQAIQKDTTKPYELTVNQKAIILWGNLDRTHKKTDKQAILELLPNGKIIELEDCAHFPDIEAPETFANAIRSVSNAAV